MYGTCVAICSRSGAHRWSRGRNTLPPDGAAIARTEFPARWPGRRGSRLPSRPLRRCSPTPARALRPSPMSSTTPRMSISSPTSTVRSEQRSSSVRRIRRPSRSMRSLTTVSPPCPGSRRDQAAVRRQHGLIGIDPDVIAHPHARVHGVLRDAHDECPAADHRPPGSPPRRRGSARARAMVCGCGVGSSARGCCP